MKGFHLTIKSADIKVRKSLARPVKAFKFKKAYDRRIGKAIPQV